MNKHISLNLYMSFSAQNTHFHIATPEIAAQTMLYEFEAFFVIEVEHIFKT